MELPLISIIIPAYNAEKYIAETIQSALSQTCPYKEIIIVNDGSTDGTLEAARAFESRGVKIIDQPNKGAASARNAGLKQAQGEYIQFLDADDLLSPDKIESQLNCLNGSLTNPAICKTVHFNNGENYLTGKVTHSWFDTDNDNPIDFLIKLYAGNEVMPGYGGMIPIHAWLTPRNLIDKAGPWNENLSLDDDGEFFCRVVLASNGIKFSNEGLCYYRKFTTQTSLSSQKNKQYLQSAVTATDLKFEHLKAKTTDPIIDRIFAKHYWWAGVLAYPQFKDLSSYCIKKGKELGYTGEKYVGGPTGHFITSVLGWRAARRLTHFKQALKRL